MRFLHISDLHIGKHIGNYSLAEDQRFALGKVVALLKEENVDALVIAGDIYDKSAPSAEAIAVFDEFLRKVSELGVKVLAIPGNHDSAERLAFAQSILERQEVYFPPVYDGAVMRVELEDEFGPVTFWLLPFIKPAMARKLFPESPIGNDYTEAVRAVLSACAVDESERNVLVAHQFVTAGHAGPERAQEELDLGGMDNVDASLFDAFDYVALGHVHRPQRVGRDTVRYAGSLLKYSVSEADRPKSVVLVDVGAKTQGQDKGACVSTELVELEPLRDLRIVEGPLKELTSQEVVGAANPQDYVFARLTDEVPQLDAMAKLRAVYPHVIGLEEVGLEVSAADEDGVDVNLEDFDPFQAFGVFFERQTGKSLDGRQLEVAEEALHAAVEGSLRGAGEQEGRNQEGQGGVR